MSARRLRVLAVVVCLVPGAASVVALLLAIWLSDDRWALTGILMVVLTIVGGFFGSFLAARANDVDSITDLIRRQLIRERNEAIDRAEREIGWR